MAEVADLQRFSSPESSNIAGATWDPQTDTLTVDFVSGDSYDYMNVPASTYRAFAASGSKGQFFIRQIKSRYSYEKR